MKKFLFCVILCLTVLSTSAMGVYSVRDDTTPSGGLAAPQYIPDVYITNEISTVEDLGEYVGTSVYALSPVRPTDATGLKRVMLELIGNYDAIVVEHEYQSNNNYSNYLREIQPDYPWLCSCGLFVVVLFCILRGGFAVLCRL